MREAYDSAALYRLLTWLSPSYPVGAFSHSHGLEWAAEAGWLQDRQGLTLWISGLLRQGGAWNDAVLFVAAWRAADRADAARIEDIAALALAAAGSRERRLETAAQGEAFRRISTASWPVPALALLQGVPEGDLAYPLAVAVLAAGHGVPLEPSLSAYLQGFAANLVSAALRLLPMGQTDGQRCLAALEPDVADTAARACALPDGDPFDHLESAVPLSDLAALKHETQYTRLFRT